MHRPLIPEVLHARRARTLVRRSLAAAATLAVAALPTLPSSAVAGARCYAPPVEARVIRPFDAPACDYCAGHRGLDFDTRPGQVVLAVAAGSVSFAGLVARVRYVVVAQDDGLRATYGQLATSSVDVGRRVRAGQAIGTTTDVLFFGLRDGERYLDPAPLLGTWHRRARLVPLDGSPRRPGPPPQLVCRNHDQGG